MLINKKYEANRFLKMFPDTGKSSSGEANRFLKMFPDTGKSSSGLNT